MKKTLPPLLLFAAALALRLFYLWEIADSPFFASPVVDAYTYSQQARLIAADHWFDYTPDPFWQPPLYPWFLGLLCWGTGEHFLLAARLVQALGGALACLLVYWLGRRLFGPEVGLLAGALLAAYGPAIAFDGELLPASLATLCFPALLLAALWAGEGNGARRWLAPGLLLGAAALNVATFLVLAPLLGLWLWMGKGERRLRLARLGLFAGGCLLVIAPVTLRNWAMRPELVLISWNDGVNFYLGNNPDYPRTLQIRPGQGWLELMARPTQAGLAPGAQSSRYFWGQSWEYIRSQPLEWIGLTAGKAANFWSGEEVGRNQNLYHLRHYSYLLAGLLWMAGLAFPFGLVAPLALTGLVLARRATGPPRLLAGAVLLYAAGVALFFVTDRYRLPALPGLLLFAALALRWLAEQVRRRQWRAAWLAGIPLLLWWCNRGAGAMGMEGDAEAFYNLGAALVEQRRLGEGIKALEQAAAMVPEDADVLFTLGTAYALAGNQGQAIAVLARAAGRYPERLDIRLNLGNSYFQDQRYGQAAEEYRAVLAAHPDHLETLRSAARATARAGQRDHAITYYEQLRHLDPRAIEPCLALGYFHRQAGRREQALDFYLQALGLDPNHLTALLESGALHLELGRPTEAQASFRRAMAIDPRTPGLQSRLDSLEQAQRRAGRTQ
ncbi:MAG: tetratricopeptide repeat protein [Candidatus Handelsmanbacteria bacterium]|nr:tetratricopeptide repeat protein [Candidatus Handelsmanbacteria bacterium]